MIASIFQIISTYLISSLSPAIILSKFFGMKDPRSYGSANPGASNVFRSNKKWVALLVLILDFLKSLLPIMLYCNYMHYEHIRYVLVFTAVLGHVYPVYYYFKGGRGVASFMGCLLISSIKLFAFVIISWVIGFIFFRRAAMASSTCFIGLIALVISMSNSYEVDTAFICATSLLVLYRHYFRIKEILF